MTSERCLHISGSDEERVGDNPMPPQLHVTDHTRHATRRAAPHLLRTDEGSGKGLRETTQAHTPWSALPAGLTRESTADSTGGFRLAPWSEATPTGNLGESQTLEGEIQWKQHSTTASSN